MKVMQEQEIQQNDSLLLLEAEEVWSKMDGIPSNYEISTKGRVRREKLNNEYEYLRHSISGEYLTVCLEGQQFLVHLLVAKTFVPNPENKEEVNHKDRNKLNPAAYNLEWVTHSENMRHAIRTGAKGVKVVECKETGETFLGCLAAAHYYRFPAKAVANSINTGMSCFGYHFNYIDDPDNTIRLNSLYLTEPEIIRLSTVLNNPDDLAAYFSRD